MEKKQQPKPIPASPQRESASEQKEEALGGEPEIVRRPPPRIPRKDLEPAASQRRREGDRESQHEQQQQQNTQRVPQPPAPKEAAPRSLAARPLVSAPEPRRIETQQHPAPAAHPPIDQQNRAHRPQATNIPPSPPDSTNTSGGGPESRRRRGAWQTAAALLLTVAAVLLLMGNDQPPARTHLPPPATAETIPNEIVVDLVDSITDAEIATLGQTLGIQLRYNSIYSQSTKLMVATVSPAERARILTTLAQNPLVEAAEPHYIYHAMFDGTHPPNDPGYARQWHFQSIGMEEAWKSTRGKGVIVAVLDTGVSAENHAQWRQAQDFGQTPFTKGYDFVNKDDFPEDDVAHGTHVSGTIAESTDNGILGAGIAPEATIMPIKVLGPRGGGQAGIVEGIRFAADHGANVINLSLGGGPYSTIFESACQYAYDKGVIILCAAGNSGQQGVEYPARYQSCMAVSAVGPQGELAPYSTWGEELAIAAPGGDISQGPAGGIWQNTIQIRRGLFSSSLQDGFFPFEGSSMAAPHVAGVAALLVSLGVKDPAEIRSILRKTAKPKTPAAQYGAGLLDAAAAVKSVSQGQRQSSMRWGLAVILAILGLGVALGRSQELGRGASISQFALPLALGLCLPDLLEFVFGFGSVLNMIGHSILLPIAWLKFGASRKKSLQRALAVTVGLVVHLSLDASSGATPFAVLPQWRIFFWLVANVAVGFGLLMFAFQEEAVSKKTVQVGA